MTATEKMKYIVVPILVIIGFASIIWGVVLHDREQKTYSPSYIERNNQIVRLCIDGVMYYKLPHYNVVVAYDRNGNIRTCK